MITFYLLTAGKLQCSHGRSRAASSSGVEPFLVNAVNFKSFVQKQLYRRHIIRLTRIVKGVPTESTQQHEDQHLE